ncbi:MAG: hypothetical protein ACR2ID_00120 [Chthoniobacterales bacterium]
MKTKSTYSLLLNADAEEKGRSIFETAVYSLVVLCTGFSFWAFATSQVTLPGQASVKPAPASAIAQAIAETPAVASSN